MRFLFIFAVNFVFVAFAQTDSIKKTLPLSRHRHSTIVLQKRLKTQASLFEGRPGNIQISNEERSQLQSVFEKKGLTENFISRLQTSPTLTLVPLVCTLVTLMWHMPMFHTLLDDYFVLSQNNVFRHNRYLALILSSVSHISTSHLIMNLLSFVTFGSILRYHTLIKYSLWPLVLGASIAGSSFFLIQDLTIGNDTHINGDGNRGCVGLSGVSLALLGVLCKTYPDRDVGFDLGNFVSLRMTYNTLLWTSMLWSFFGSVFPSFNIIQKQRSSFAGSTGAVAHSTHLGGILFGILYRNLLVPKSDNKDTKELKR